MVGGCNCRSQPCPLNGNCLENCVIYKADVDTGTLNNSYVGSTETEFKKRWRNHKTSILRRRERHPTTLSRYVWEVKDNGFDPNINWSRLKRAIPYQCGGQKCSLCLEEKLTILQAPPHSLINKRSELLNRCHHKRKHRLISLKMM